MTKILYYESPIIVECTAVVLTCVQAGDFYKVTLDRSMIFPEGGGQLADRGSIDDVAILDAQVENGETVHYCAAPVQIGKRVSVKLDIASRLDHAQQHTGEHILSGLASKLFSAKNVGFHMAEDYCTIDFDVFLDSEQLNALELEANAAVRANRRIHTEVTDGAHASELELRKRAENIEGEIRLVYIDNGKVDSCTCCGTHLDSTGMVGAIKITDSQKYKGGTRLFFVCGGRATDAAMRTQDAMTALARRFSTSREELPAAVMKQSNDLITAKLEIKAKSALLAELYAQKFSTATPPVKGIVPIVEIMDGLTANDLKLLCDTLVQTCPCVALLFVPHSQGTDYRMSCSAKSGMNMKELCSAVNAAVGGKGGGSPLFAQGKTPEQVHADTVAMLKNYITSVLKNSK